ncbi:hypothetical protein EIN_241960, partial [Entamoeba invadens IP1]
MLVLFTSICFSSSPSCSFQNTILTNITVSNTCSAFNKITIGSNTSLDVIQLKILSNANVQMYEIVNCVGNGSIVQYSYSRMNLKKETNFYNTAKLEMNENSQLTINNKINFWHYSQITFKDRAILNILKEFYINDYVTVVLHHETIINTAYLFYLTDHSIFTMNDDSIIHTLNYLYIYGATLLMNSYTKIIGLEYLNVFNKAQVTLNDHSEINNNLFIFKFENSFLTLNKFSKINNINDFNVIKGSILTMNGIKDTPQITTNTLRFKSGVKLNIAGKSLISVNTEFVFVDSIIIVNNRDIRDLPVVFYSSSKELDIKNSKIQSDSDFDVICSWMAISITNIFPGTKLLLGGKLLRYGTSNKIFCHVEDVINKNVKYSEFYCPCDDMEDWYITPLPNMTSLYVKINSPKTSSKTRFIRSDEFSSESVTIGNTQISFYKSDRVILGISIPETVVMNSFTLTKTVLVVSNTKLIFENKHFNAAININQKFKILVIHCTKEIYNKTSQQCEDPTICDDVNCKYCPLNKNNCITCKNHFSFDNSKCEQIANCELTFSNRCLKCLTGFLLRDGLCVSDATCLLVQFDGKCQICNKNNGYIYNNGECVKSDINGEVTTNNNVVSCYKGFGTNSTNCLKCNDLYKKSELCENGKVTKCDSSSKMDTNGMCKKNTCETPNDQNGRCTTAIDNCIFLSNGKCNECENGYILHNNKCNKNGESNCITQKNFGCLICNNTFYLDELTKQCVSCDSSCLTCVETSTKCLSCPPNMYLSNYKCNTNNELKMKCDRYASFGSGCVVCKDGYYRVGLDCFKCDQKCKTCNNKYSCLTCNSTNYKTNGGDCLPQSDIVGCAVNVTQSGCLKCQDGYHIANTNECQKCNDNCNTCTTTRNKCTSCVNSRVLLANKSCVGLSQVSKCKEITHSKCSKCSFWYSPIEDGTLCESRAVWWVILVVVLFVLIVFVILIISIIVVTKIILNKLHTHEIEKTITLFNMNKSNINFVPLRGGVSVSSTVIDLNSDIEQIEVNKETRQVLCVGNTNKNATKIQFTISSNITKFTIRVDPEVVTLKSNFACEFSVFVKPLCSCKINNTIQLVS